MNILQIMEEGERLLPSVSDQGRSVESFEEKFDSLMGLLLNEKGFSTHKRRYLLEEAATSSDFPILFGNVLERQLLAKYKTATPDWRAYIGVGQQRDFRASGQEVIGVFGLRTRLKEVPPTSEYKSDEEYNEGKVAIVLRKFGRVFPLAWEAMINDDLGAFNDVADDLVQAALITEYYHATELYVASTGPHTGMYGDTLVHPIDGATLDNLEALAFNIDNLGTVITAMRGQKDINNNPVVVEGFELVVPPALEIPMLKALNPAAVVLAGTAGAVTKESSANVVAQLNITGHVNPYLPIIDVSGAADKTWYVFAKLSTGQAARLNFMTGRAAPQLVMKNSNKVTVGGAPLSAMEGDFESDSIRWRIRHILGGTRIDPRLTFASVGP